MTRAILIVSTLFAMSVWSQQPQFRAATSWVRLEVSITDDRGAVQGLTANDLVVEDRGVRQRIRVEEVADAPLDLVLVAQPTASFTYTSGRYHSAMIDSDQVPRMVAGLEAFLDQVEDRDRVAVVLAGAPPIRLRKMESGRPLFDMDAFAGERHAAVFDGIAAAMTMFPESERRRALVVFTNAADSRSVLSMETLVRMAERLGPQLVLVGPAVKVDDTVISRAMTTSGVQIGEPVLGVLSGTVFPWPIQSLARRTGGITVNLGAGEPRRLIAALFERLRTQYILSYEAPPHKGWHPVSVTVNRRGATVRTREGYFVE